MLDVFEIAHATMHMSHFIMAYQSGSITKGNKYKLLNHRFHYDWRKHYFSACIVNIWNSCPHRVNTA